MKALPLILVACLAIAGCQRECVGCDSKRQLATPPGEPQLRNVPARRGDWVLVTGYEERAPASKTWELKTGDGPHGIVWASKKPLTGEVFDAGGKSLGSFRSSRGGLALPSNQAVRVQLVAEDWWALAVYRHNGEVPKGMSVLPPDLPEFRR